MGKLIIKSVSLFIIIFMFLTANVFVVSSTSAFADDILNPYQYEIEFDNGTIFYMYIGNDSSKSGLYYNAEPLANIYLLEPSTYFYENQLVFSADGIHFAHLPWTSYNWDSGQGGVAIAFYSNGSLTQQYLLNEVVTDISVLEPSVSHVMWEDYSKRTFDTEENYLRLTALDGTIAGFNISTGKMILRDPRIGFPCSFCGGSDWGKYWCRHSGYLGYKIIGIIVGSVLLAFALTIGILLVYKAKKKNHYTNL